jgi:inosine-uridine nucleoside N-ribohydrolase
VKGYATTKVVMDVDIGIDYSKAIMMVLQLLKIEIVYATTGDRNTSVRIASVNTLGSKDREIERE